MFFALLSTFLSSIATNLWKKALSFWASKELFLLLSKSSVILITIVLAFFHKLDFWNIHLYTLGIIAAIMIIWSINTLIEQYIYSVEKISVLVPYTSVNKMLTIIVSFFLFNDISFLTLIITLMTIVIIVMSSLDFTRLKLSPIILLFLLKESITSVTLLLTWYTLLEISSSAFFVFSYIISIIFIGSIVLYKGQFSELKTLPKKFYAYRLVACHIWGISFLFSMLVITELGLSMSILLSFIGMISTLIISYITFHDIPRKKDILVTIIVTTMIGIWYYFK